MKGLLDSLKNLFHHRNAGASEKESEILVTLRHAAEGGDAKAQCRLGDMYYNGESVVQDYAAAAEWYRRAAEQGHAAAQFQLGSMYRVGLGILQNDAQAVKWLRCSAAQGDPAAQALLDHWADRSPAGEKNFLEAVKRLHIAAGQGHAGAQYILGGMYETGNGVNHDPSAAWAWYELALQRLEAGPWRDLCLNHQDRLTASMTPPDRERARQLLTGLQSQQCGGP